jgi:hypothetical protein
MVNTAFIEAVAESMARGFPAKDEDYRSGLHSIPMVCHTPSRTWINFSC